ncbi:MAG TPA: NAD-dependent epimerase/dehydratase family protein [Lacipirellulaceae bacterium]|jgi:hypothetical protein|nr:NAD-dependent epimerase/dehydratase family protein [Lacipirellulaceae bacterium]
MLAPSNEDELEMRLSEATDAVRDVLAKLSGDLIVLGAGGKMGPSLCRMARLAAGDARRIIAVSRFTDRRVAAQLQASHIEVIPGDLLDRAFVRSLPRCPLVVYMTGMKFGSTSAPEQTWTMNTVLPAMVCEHFRSSRIVAFSTGNVYPLVPVTSRGCSESEPLAPVGEYAASCLGRERIFTFFSREWQIPVSLIRLNYAVELRYGVLVDIGRRIWQQEPVPLAMGYANVIWQADANAQALATFPLATSPPFILNVTGAEIIRVRDVANRFGELLQRPVKFVGEESPTALLNDANQALQLFGRPRVDVQQLIAWIAGWLRAGGTLWDKPTHFEVRDGRF